mmetsp:Transcript_27689/g.46366  ORF Transcript_27689/g.46366 Transcript_27689/m.46366 type:complete len:311 (-) Transcript_27689:29-961(-)|eukprot:CAMPEP_0198211536 /NCGR_PEP_ID=MMETSP1445-20131203/24367_1 /TAXON_ID=36898 /ORGANISM="Pyramimonas sp., Strain CCMP2087" /LENGTH=310 /DNA_ID=CAMNT_0043885811 /DNA_START=124 /DNA_END=1056 /DNA_ORIENTATION=-
MSLAGMFRTRVTIKSPATSVPPSREVHRIVARANGIVCRAKGSRASYNLNKLGPNGKSHLMPLRSSPREGALGLNRRMRCEASASGENSTDSKIVNERTAADAHTPKDIASPSSGLNIPTMLTLLRVAVIPALVSIYFLPDAWVPSTCAAMFVGAAITDWLDGYLARKWDQSTAFGAFLDPVADKLMVTAALVLLCTKLPTGPATQYPWLLPVSAIVIIAREITVSAIREWAAAAGGDAHKAVAVNSIGKWKTAAQMTAITLLLLLRDSEAVTGPVVAGQLAGAGLLLVATFLTIWSLWVYMSGALKYMK